MLTLFSSDAAQFFKSPEHLGIFKQVLIIIFSQEITGAFYRYLCATMLKKSPLGGMPQNGQTPNLGPPI